MEKDQQSKLEAFLQTPQAYGRSADELVSRIDTHISTVFLVGDRAYKLKKPVNFGYLDFTTPEKRHDACVHELELNRRTAPQIYLDVVPVRRVDDAFFLGPGEGTIIDWLLKMVRFEQSDVLSHKAMQGVLTREMIEELAQAMQGFHETAEIHRDAGGGKRFAQILRSSAENFAPFIGSVYQADEIERLNSQVFAELQAVGPLLDARRDAGWVRHCHSDLHLGNVALIDDRPVPFDCIEFNDDFARVDILYDLAFLLMDLSFRAKESASLAGFANSGLNAYLQASPLENWEPLVEGLQAMRLFMSTRAGVRSHVNARTWANATREPDRQMAAALAVSYARYAVELLMPSQPGLYAVGGLSGTGKSTVAKGLAPLASGPIGAVHLRTDVIRKKQAGVALNERLPPSAYTQEASDAVYAEMFHIAQIALKAGNSVICDAVFAQPAERAEIEAIANNVGVPFMGLWLTASARALEIRVDRRTRTENDASDATVDVVKKQLSYDVGEVTWGVIDSEGSREAVLARCVQALNFTSP